LKFAEGCTVGGGCKTLRGVELRSEEGCARVLEIGERCMEEGLSFRGELWAGRAGARMERGARRGLLRRPAETPGDRFTSVYVYIHDAWPRSQEKILGGAERFFGEGEIED